LRRVLLKLSAVLPLLGMLIPMVFGFFQPGYSSISQHMSELEALHGSVAMATRVGSLATGLSIVFFSVALLWEKSSRMPFTAAAALVFGASMMSNGIFVFGSPLHGLHAIGLSSILVPAFFAAEYPRTSGALSTDRLSLIASALILIYMWLLMTGLDPAATRGLTQRLAVVPLFGWYTYASIKMLRMPETYALTGLR
jgi:Protein of unknown function (DUF998)